MTHPHLSQTDIHFISGGRSWWWREKKNTYLSHRERHLRLRCFFSGKVGCVTCLEDQDSVTKVCIICRNLYFRLDRIHITSWHRCSERTFKCPCCNVLQKEPNTEIQPQPISHFHNIKVCFFFFFSSRWLCSACSRLKRGSEFPVQPPFAVSAEGSGSQKTQMSANDHITAASLCS